MCVCQLKNSTPGRGISLCAGKYLSFELRNLLQLYLLKAMRVEHGVSLQRVRRALPELRQRHGSQFPLLQQDLLTDGLDLFLKDEAGFVNLSHAAQTVIHEHFELYLSRIDLSGKVGKLYPCVG